MNQHHGGAAARRKLLLEDLTAEIIGGDLEVHREVGPGLMESAHEECLGHELRLFFFSDLLRVSVSPW